MLTKKIYRTIHIEKYIGYPNPLDELFFIICVSQINIRHIKFVIYFTDTDDKKSDSVHKGEQSSAVNCF